MVSGEEFLPHHGVWSQIVSARRHGDLLFLRYGLRSSAQAVAPDYFHVSPTGPEAKARVKPGLPELSSEPVPVTRGTAPEQWA